MWFRDGGLMVLNTTFNNMWFREHRIYHKWDIGYGLWSSWANKK